MEWVQISRYHSEGQRGSEVFARGSLVILDEWCHHLGAWRVQKHTAPELDAPMRFGNTRQPVDGRKDKPPNGRVGNCCDGPSDPSKRERVPARGTLFASRPDAVASHFLKWMSLNLILFLFPFFSGLLALYSLGDRLGIYNHESPKSLAYTLAYFAISSGSANIFIAGLIFPTIFRYHLVGPLILGRRRHRSHFSFMSNRRMNRVCGKSCWTIFVMGFQARSLPVVVNGETTIDGIYWQLQNLGVVPTSGFPHFYFTYGGRRIRWDDTMNSLGLGPLSHLHLKLAIPGGATQGPDLGTFWNPRPIPFYRTHFGSDYLSLWHSVRIITARLVTVPDFSNTNFFYYLTWGPTWQVLLQSGWILGGRIVGYSEDADSQNHKIYLQKLAMALGVISGQQAIGGEILTLELSCTEMSPKHLVSAGHLGRGKKIGDASGANVGLAGQCNGKICLWLCSRLRWHQPTGCPAGVREFEFEGSQHVNSRKYVRRSEDGGEPATAYQRPVELYRESCTASFVELAVMGN
ncbi:hypothetical protein B0H14DRAFT_2615489 [Mycena olivaceomarginata]|nr:hypothetical protein B0H14DRAFT_2615489 [Mycena olivaceomarginata]